MGAETRYHPSQDQLELATALEESVNALLPISRLHSSFQESDEAWSELEALGIFGISVGEELGGSGLGSVEETLVVMKLGRQLASPSVLATFGATHARRDGAAIADVVGQRVASAYRRDGRIVLVGESDRDLVLVREDAGATLYKVSAAPSEKIDDRFWATRLWALPENGEIVGRVDAAQLLRLRLIDAAALAGIAERALEMAVAYANLREQFGRPIGTFQAVKHYCANMAVAARCARDQVSYAAVALDDGRDDAELQVECAFLVAGNSALENAGTNIQIHGGIGFSDEADPHLLVKRAQLLIAIAGGLEAANIRVGTVKACD